jgi:hypothetical protein
VVQSSRVAVTVGQPVCLLAEWLAEVGTIITVTPVLSASSARTVAAMATTAATT